MYLEKTWVNMIPVIAARIIARSLHKTVSIPLTTLENDSFPCFIDNPLKKYKTGKTG
jgi:hypothetical protein